MERKNGFFSKTGSDTLMAYYIKILKKKKRLGQPCKGIRRRLDQLFNIAMEG